jgi:DNA-binding GntR family transcriptional regulator
MIDPDYLSFLRTKYSAQDVLLLVQLSHIVPNWWANQPELARQLRIEPHTTSQAIRRLQKRKLIEMISYGKGGTFIWWVKKSAKDVPDIKQAPSWTIKNLETGKKETILIQDRQAWAERNNLHYGSFRLFLCGYRKVMAKKFQLVSTPIDKYSKTF